MLKTTCAIDAALNHSGYAINDSTMFIKTGVFTPYKNLPLQDKLLVISEWLSDLIEKYKVDDVVIEGCYTARNPKTTYQLSLVHGAIMLTASRHGVKVTVIPPAKVKRAVTGRGNADKEEIARAVTALYSDELSFDRISEQPYASDITDAIAILHAYLNDDNQTDNGRRKKSRKRTTRQRSQSCGIKKSTTEKV